MTINAKTATLFSALGLLIGGVAVIGAQVHAQSAVTPTVTQMPATHPIATPTDTDNIQDPNGVEKVDAPSDSSAMDKQDPADAKEVSTPGDKQDKAGDNTANDQETAD